MHRDCEGQKGKKRALTAHYLQAVFKVWLSGLNGKLSPVQPGPWSQPCQGWVSWDSLPKSFSNTFCPFLKIFFSFMKNVTKSWKFLINSSMGQWKRLCKQDRGVPWWHKIPQGQGFLHSYSGKKFTLHGSSELQRADLLPELLPAGTSAL